MCVFGSMWSPITTEWKKECRQMKWHTHASWEWIESRCLYLWFNQLTETKWNWNKTSKTERNVWLSNNSSGSMLSISRCLIFTYTRIQEYVYVKQTIWNNAILIRCWTNDRKKREQKTTTTTKIIKKNAFKWGKWSREFLSLSLPLCPLFTFHFAFVLLIADALVRSYTYSIHAWH